jgi:uncharacterized OB-fold protein
MTRRPMPIPDRSSQAFWDAAACHLLVVPRCEDCAKLLFPPSPRCPACAGDRLTWIELSGRVRLRSWTRMHLDVLPGMSPPFLVAEADLVEQPGTTLVALVEGLEPAELRTGMPLAVAFTDGAVSLLQFVPVSTPSPRDRGTTG